MHEELYDAASKLEGQIASHILIEIIFEVANKVEAAETLVSKCDWINKLIGRLLKARDHHKLIQTVNSLRAIMEEMQKQFGFMAIKCLKNQSRHPLSGF